MARSKAERNELIKREIEKVKSQFTEKLKEYMKKNGLTQKGLGIILNNSQAHVSNLVSGKENVSLEKMVETMYYIDQRISLDFSDVPIAQRMFNQNYRDINDKNGGCEGVKRWTREK